MKRYPFVAMLVALLAGAAACDDSHRAPTPTAPTPAPAPAPTPAPALQVVSLRISGNPVLPSIGATTPLTATAVMSDGTTQDVTTAARWSSSDTATVTVSTAGMVTALRFGSSRVTAQSGTRSATLTIFATPDNTFVALGRVREPGNSGIPGVEVREMASGLSVLSNEAGEYSLGGLTAGRLSLAKDGYEPIAAEGLRNTYLDLSMQRVLRVAAGEKLNVNLAPHDMDYAVAGGGRCYPCRMIRVTTTGSGTLQLRAGWVETHATLSIWVNGQAFEGAAHGPSEAAGEIAVAAGETLVYVGMKTAVEYYAPFTLTTAIVK